MANSRSNIYPVKLQGAELNLNKFDAEIKQYSGFNKNNSPFVGGCLSNLFTKTEENTTGSSDSVYVDDNGDVYEAKTDGLYKNGKKIMSLSLGDPYYNYPIEFKKLNLPKNTIWVQPINIFEEGEVRDEEFLYVTREDSESSWLANITFHYLDYSYSTSIVLRDSDNIPLNIQSIDIVYNNSILVRVSGIRNNKVYMHANAFDFNRSTPSITRENLNVSINVNTADYINIPPTEGSGGFFIYGLDECYKNDGTKFTISETGSSGRTTCIGKSKYYYNPKIGNARLLDVTNYTTSGSQSIMLDVDVSINYAAGTITLDKDNGTPSASYASGTTLSVKMGKINNAYSVNGCYALRFSDNKLFYGVSGNNYTNYVTLADDKDGNKQAMMYMGVLAYGILYNNGIAVGISLDGQSLTGKLISEWNSVSEKYIIFGDNFNSVAYKNINNNEWYYAKVYNNFDFLARIPRISLRKVNNQLVMNVTGKNSYRLSDGEILYFASDWNNRILKSFDTSITKSGTAITNNAGYMATSINEYNLKDNASILLNPVPVIKLPNVSYNNPLNNEVEDVGMINVYKGADEILYAFSAFISAATTEAITYDIRLTDFPFPINTSGNVQLSPSLFCKTERFGNDVFIKEGSNAYQLIKEGSESVMSYYLGTLIENLEDIFILQGQYYVIINKQIFNVQFSGGVVQSLSFVVSVENLQFCGNSAYQAYFFSKTNRCIYVFTGANILNQLQLVDKISEIYAYKYNQSTQSIILITDIGTIVSSNLGMYLIEGFTPDDVFFYDKGVVFVSDSELTYLQYYEADGFEKHNIEVETCFYGMNNETVTINDCLYFRLFSEEHEEGEVKVSATTISLKGRKTETTVFKFKASDWDALTHSVYVRYQPKEQRGLGISFSIDSPFKIASLSVGSKADAILVDKVSKGAVITPSNNDEW